MWRIRLLRVLLPIVILVFITAVAQQWQPPEQVHSNVQEDAERIVQQGSGLELTQLDGNTESMRATVESYTQTPDGTMLLEQVQDFNLARETQPPLIIDSEEGQVRGEAGARKIRFDRGVEVYDPAYELTLRIPSLFVDEKEGTATSLDQVELEGEALHGGARGLVYGLEGQPTELRRLDLEDADGSTLRAELALLHDGFDDIELLDNVQVRRLAQDLDADRMRVERVDGTIRRAVADGNVRGSTRQGLRRVRFLAEAADLKWDVQTGDTPSRTLLHGAVLLEDGRSTLRCEALDILARPLASGNRFDVTARGGVEVEGRFGLEQGTLRSATLEARIADDGLLDDASAFGGVEFVGTSSRGEAARAHYERTSDRLTLSGNERRRARLARERIRVAAETIVTDPRGDRMDAAGSVESTLLPGDGEGLAGGLFAGDEVVHFVAERLESEQQAQALHFSGSVRGWQGDRSLAAQSVRLDQFARSLTAQRQVHSRIPRIEGASTAADFIEVVAEELRYDDARSLGRYRDDVRMTLAEGWMESGSLDVIVGANGELRELSAEGEVELEFERPAEEPQEAPSRIVGKADRVLFEVEKQVVWLVGEDKPAEVEHFGERAGTTEGRVLRYHLETGALEVASTTQAPARIRGGGR